MLEPAPHRCPECDAYQGHKPVIELQRNPRIAGGAWEIFIFDPNTQTYVVIGARDNGNWSVSPALKYVEGTRIDPWIHG